MKYIKHPIPEEISDKGGASVQLVQKQTIPLDGAIDAAIEAHYAIGQKEFIRNGVIGTMKSMAAGVRRDGRSRSIDGFLTVYPVFKGPVDLEKGYDPAVNKVQIRARLLNELELDITKWSFEDVTPGKKAFKVGTVKAGNVIGVVETGQVIEVNGDGLPSTKAGEELRIHWEAEGTDKSGDIPAAKLTSDVSRIDIAEDALAELASEAYDGKTVVFTVRGNFSTAKIAAKLKYVAPAPAPTAAIDNVTGFVLGSHGQYEMCTITGENFGGEALDGDGIWYKSFLVDGTTREGQCTVGTWGDGEISMIGIDEEDIGEWALPEKVELTLKTHAGVPGSTQQVLTCETTAS